MNDETISNRSGNRPFEDVVRNRVSRRSVVAGGLAAAAAFVATDGTAGALGTKANVRPRRVGDPQRRARSASAPTVGFSPVPVADANGPEVTISKDYRWAPLIPWGTALQPGGPGFTWPPADAAHAEHQVGIGHDGMTYFGDDAGGMLCINHEFGTTPHVLGKDAPESLDDVRIMQAVHGVSVVKIVKKAGTWDVAASKNSRRITVNSPVDFPKNGTWGWNDKQLRNKAANPYQGTANNCANGETPWGTYLTCEENFNGYFGAKDETWEPSARQARYGLSAGGFGYGWHEFDPRFDLSNPDYANEANRFGWVVEIDPNDASAKPMKRPMLGRMKHEGAAMAIGRGNRAVVYMGDDERFDYIYKYVSAAGIRSLQARGKSPLDHGSLYVARFDDDGRGEWIELHVRNPILAKEFHDQGELLTYARVAADLVEATPMDRPEWSSVHPDGSVYFTLTNNSRRDEPDAANPMAPNPDGHIIKILDDDEHVGTGFSWDIFLKAVDTHGTESAFGSADGLWCDPDGRVFIQTDGGQPNGMNDQMLVSDGRGELRRLLSGVNGCEVTGIATTPDRRTLFVNLQHPGNGDPAETNFPAATDGKTVPRDSTLVITRKDGGIVGS